MVPRAWPAGLFIIVVSQVCCLAQQKQPALGSHSVATLTVDGLQFRDLNRDGKPTAKVRPAQSCYTEGT